VFTAGSTVKAGFYFNRDKLDLIAVGHREPALPGAEGERYSRVPALAALLLAPIVGAAFIVIAPGTRLGLLFHRIGRLAPPLVGLVRQRLASLVPSRRKRREPESVDDAKAPGEAAEK
jgi:hypothetical protein